MRRGTTAPIGAKRKSPADAEDRPALLEALLYEPDGGYCLFLEHLERLSASADTFGYPLDVEELSSALTAHAVALRTRTKVRVELDARGQLLFENAPVRPSGTLQCGTVALSVPSDNMYLRHKTSERSAYRVALESRPDCDDVILYNERGELTETTTGNLVVELDGRKLTPHLAAGLLPGTYRRHLLERQEVHEARLTLDDLRHATGLWMVNSVRRHCRIRLCSPDR